MLIEGVFLEEITEYEDLEDLEEIEVKFVKGFISNLVIDSRIKTIADKLYNGNISKALDKICCKAENSLYDIADEVPEVTSYIDKTFDSIIDELFSEVSK